MGVRVSFDTVGTTAEELKAVRAFIDSLVAEEPAVAVIKSEPEAQAAEPEAPAAPVRRKPGPKPRPKPEPEPELEPEPVDEPADDVMGDGPSLDEAQARARELVGDGKTSVVRKALDAVGVKRVGELAPGQVAAFMKALG